MENETYLNTILHDVGLSNCRESEKPEYRVWHAFQYIYPDIQDRWVDFIKLVEITKDDGFLRQAILLTSSEQRVAWHFLASSSFTVGLRGSESILNQHTFYFSSHLIVGNHILYTAGGGQGQNWRYKLFFANWLL